MEQIISSPSISPSQKPDGEEEQTIRDVLGTFMLVITCFVFFFGVWTYRVNLKQFFQQVRFSNRLVCEFFYMLHECPSFIFLIIVLYNFPSTLFVLLVLARFS